jgi:Asp-tRNA(Asn)/Glu-tRNA(Gln) amidotransferase A subunit family amidase
MKKVIQTSCFSQRINLLILCLFLLYSLSCKKKEKPLQEEETPGLSMEVISSAENTMGLFFNEWEKELMAEGLSNQLKMYEHMRACSLKNSVPPAICFNPFPVGFKANKVQESIDWELPNEVSLPENIEDLAFYNVAELSCLIKSRKVSSTELTKMYIMRLKKYGDTLHCVITLTEELALQQAAKADEEISNGLYKGPLHGIPYGIKDLLALEGYKTTWGAAPYKDQVITNTATVIKKLDNAGAVLLAKLSMGALAMGDIWYSDTTRNPWNLNKGSSGSSAGSASATAAGLVGFSIGTETLGSIVSPSTRCGVTGLRPTYGRVSRTGAMALCWTMDKIGPICRTAEDCALVFNVIRGPDGIDQTLYDLPFNYKPTIDLSNLKIGYLKEAFDCKYTNRKNDQKTLKVLKKLGANLIPVSFPKDLPVSSLRIILNAEAAAAFDELTRSDRDTLLVNQSKWAWPNSFRLSRFIPAVEYIQANRFRYLLIQQMNEIIKEFDVIICPSFSGNQLLITNLTGHPCVVLPNGFNKNGNPVSISFVGKLFDEATILAVAKTYQMATDFEEKHPSLFKP